MARNDSYGYSNVTYSNNTVIGSNMDGGSSGGPWIINFGKAQVLTGETQGSAPNLNTVVGVTSWGYADKSYKEQGASPFTYCSAGERGVRFGTCRMQVTD